MKAVEVQAIKNQEVSFGKRLWKKTYSVHLALHQLGIFVCRKLLQIGTNIIVQLVIVNSAGLIGDGVIA
jgi:hypothetical protein